MANENKKATALEQTAQEATLPTVNVTENDHFIVERETFTNKKDKREMYGYFVKGKYKGREIKVDFNADDQGGYEVLDIIFSIKPTAELLITENELKNDDGTSTWYTVYEVSNTDADGIEFRYKVKPARNSDKSYLNVLLQQLENERKKRALQVESTLSN